MGRGSWTVREKSLLNYEIVESRKKLDIYSDPFWRIIADIMRKRWEKNALK